MQYSCCMEPIELWWFQGSTTYCHLQQNYKLNVPISGHDRNFRMQFRSSISKASCSPLPCFRSSWSINWKVIIQRNKASFSDSVLYELFMSISDYSSEKENCIFLWFNFFRDAQFIDIHLWVFMFLLSWGADLHGIHGLLKQRQTIIELWVLGRR